jgi:hypothetical protein
MIFIHLILYFLINKNVNKYKIRSFSVRLGKMLIINTNSKTNAVYLNCPASKPIFYCTVAYTPISIFLLHFKQIIFLNMYWIIK